jgi:hypothetical protein
MGRRERRAHARSVGRAILGKRPRTAQAVTTMADPPNRTDSITVDELLGMAYDAYARARLSGDASTKQKLMRVADGYLKQAKELRRERISSDRFFNT